MDNKALKKVIKQCIVNLKQVDTLKTDHKSRGNLHYTIGMLDGIAAVIDIEE